MGDLETLAWHSFDDLSRRLVRLLYGSDHADKGYVGEYGMLIVDKLAGSGRRSWHSLDEILGEFSALPPAALLEVQSSLTFLTERRLVMKAPEIGGGGGGSSSSIVTRQSSPGNTRFVFALDHASAYDCVQHLMRGPLAAARMGVKQAFHCGHTQPTLYRCNAPSCRFFVATPVDFAKLAHAHAHAHDEPGSVGRVRAKKCPSRGCKGHVVHEPPPSLAEASRLLDAAKADRVALREHFRLNVDPVLLAKNVPLAFQQSRQVVVAVLTPGRKRARPMVASLVPATALATPVEGKETGGMPEGEMEWEDC